MDQYDSMCFACGRQNPIGLKLDFHLENDEYITVFTPGKEHQGFPGIMHGGLTATILDEVTARYVYTLGLVAFTASLEVRYKKAIPIGQPVTFKSRLLKQKNRLYIFLGQAFSADGTLLAEAKAKVMAAKDQEDLKEKYLNNAGE